MARRWPGSPGAHRALRQSRPQHGVAAAGCPHCGRDPISDRSSSRWYRATSTASALAKCRYGSALLAPAIAATPSIVTPATPRSATRSAAASSSGGGRRQVAHGPAEGIAVGADVALGHDRPAWRRGRRADGQRCRRLGRLLVLDGDQRRRVLVESASRSARCPTRGSFTQPCSSTTSTPSLLAIKSCAGPASRRARSAARRCLDRPLRPPLVRACVGHPQASNTARLTWARSVGPAAAEPLPQSAT